MPMTDFHTQLSPERAARRMLTTGDIAKLCDVAPRTVSKWVDGGKIKGIRLPGSADRRVKRDEAIRFMQASGYDLGPLAKYAEFRVVVVGLSASARSAVAAITARCPNARLLDAPTPLAVIDFAVGRATALELAKELRTEGEPLILGVVGDDDAGPAAGFDAVYTADQSVPLADRVREAVNEWARGN